MRTLLDDFAMAALTGLLANHNRSSQVHDNVEKAYQYANVMMSERNMKHNWTTWKDGNCSFIEGTVIELKFKNGPIGTIRVDKAACEELNRSKDFIALYRILEG